MDLIHSVHLNDESWRTLEILSNSRRRAGVYKIEKTIRGEETGNSLPGNERIVKIGK